MWSVLVKAKLTRDVSCYPIKGPALIAEWSGVKCRHRMMADSHHTTPTVRIPARLSEKALSYLGLGYGFHRALQFPPLLTTGLRIQNGAPVQEND